MGMACSGFLIAVTFQNRTALCQEFGLDNEESVELSREPGLFSNAASMEDVIEGFKRGFSNKWADLDFWELFLDLGDPDYFDDLAFSLNKRRFEDVREIVLLADTECDGYRDYIWEKYNLTPYSRTGGRGRGIRQAGL